jgi:hypothetical protein
MNINNPDYRRDAYYGFNFMVWQLEDHVEVFDQVPLLALAFHE